jgi:NAD(P)-dependent dehydrogenase (short-subunit alcohol dehydrogenase family)
MSNQVVLVTGALTGIGRATALAFAQTGAHVMDPVAVTMLARRSPPNCVIWARRRIRAH